VAVATMPVKEGFADAAGGAGGVGRVGQFHVAAVHIGVGVCAHAGGSLKRGD